MRIAYSIQIYISILIPTKIITFDSYCGVKNFIELSPQIDLYIQLKIVLPLRFAASAVVRWNLICSSFSGWSWTNGWSCKPESGPNFCCSSFSCFSKLKSSQNEWWKPSFNMSKHKLCMWEFRYLKQLVINEECNGQQNTSTTERLTMQ